MNESVDLLWLSDTQEPPAWSLGEAHRARTTPKALQVDVDAHLKRTRAPFLLFWDSRLGAPQPENVRHAMFGRGDVWHAGLRLGTSGLPKMIDFVAPTWMLNRDPDPDIDATSWRLSLRASLFRTRVLREMGGVCPDFHTLDAAALEMGHRYITRGVIVRHSPCLVTAIGEASIPGPELIAEDELRFIHYCFGTKWALWALFRSVLRRQLSIRTSLGCWRKVRAHSALSRPEPYDTVVAKREVSDRETATVSVLVPTLERYPFLRKLLTQLREQTVRPHEILVVDQTPVHDRGLDLEEEFNDLPIRVTYLDRAGQCSSRNAGLRQARGSHVLFLDDDDEIPPTLIEQHLESLRRYEAPVCSGVAHEVGAGALPPSFTYPRISDVFPTNNTMVERSVLSRSGLFDLAYDRGKRADGDLGMRVYLTGALMMLDSEIAVLHHHAPRGGLRAHRARVVTYASSRNQLTHRHLPSATEVYLAMRYFTEEQVREMLWLRAFGTFTARGGTITKLLKIFIGLLLLPHTLWRIRKTQSAGERMFRSFPQIPELEEKRSVSTLHPSDEP